MPISGDGELDRKSAKVLKLGLNISVSGDPGTDFEIVLDEDGRKAAGSSVKDEIQSQSAEPSKLEMPSNVPKDMLQEITLQTDVPGHSTGAIPKHRKSTRNSNPSESSVDEAERTESKESGLIEKIKSTMEHFEKFSDHIKEIPRLRNHPVATSTPFSDKFNSKSESNLVQAEYRSRKFSHLYDFKSRNEYFKSSIKPFPPDLFLKPLPGENYYKRGMYTRYFDLDPYRHYGSDNSLNKTPDYRIMCAKPKCDEKFELYNLPLDQPTGILKKFDNESGDKQSTSSAESIKDIKIYQSGGILIMQNFKENLDAIDKKEISDFSAKLIENCSKLREEITSFQVDRFFENSSDENKNSGKTVQFDLTSFDGQKSKSDSSCAALKDESSFLRMESSESTSDCPKLKDTSPQGTSQSQDFPSLSTQENDSIISNQPGTSPTFVSPKKLEWDSGADIGYINLDLTKENLSTIERIVLKGLSSDGQSKKNVIYEKKPDKNQTSRSKFVLKRIPSDLITEIVADDSGNKSKVTGEFLQEENEGKELILGEATEKKNDVGTSKEVSRGEDCKFSESKADLERVPVSKTDKSERQEREPPKKKKISGKNDKSVNVNTLWEDWGGEMPLCQSTETESSRQTEQQAKVRGRKFSPKVKKSKKKRPVSQRIVPLKADPPIAKPSKSFPDISQVDMGPSTYNSEKVGTVPVLKDAELSKEVEEILIDQRYQAKQDDEAEVTIEPATSETVVADKGENKIDNKIKTRPISASSGSNNTVLPKIVGEKSNGSTENKFISQIIQTSDAACESVGIQAFSSRVSSDCDLKSNKSKEGTKGGRENVNTSSKNIQAFGLNASLPKQLEHPKELTELITNQNTKSTQYFGGIVNSLPNYHANLVTKAKESCGRAPEVLKAKKNLEAEIIRLKEENEKNILANDVPKLAESKADSKKRSKNENKENLISKTSTNSKRSQGGVSRKTSRGNGIVSQDSEKKENENASGKEKLPSIEGSECLPTSDEISSVVLTSEVLKEHGDSIDRNIIQEKYFQSQLVEFELKKMISRSTSMEMQTKSEEDRACKKYTNTGCQYSPQSKEAINGERSKSQDNDSTRGKPNRRGRTASEQYDSSQNIAEDGFETLKSTNQERGLGTGESLPSSTQTAHSWIPGKQNSGENMSGVGRARSFEYLPGHIYESSGNLREELPSETEQNLITSSSDSDTAKGSVSDRARESEGRNTLVLENSTESSCETDRLKTLDGNLAKLNIAVLKLREKDAQVQSITRSLLANLCKKNGSGDCLTLGGVYASQVEVANNGQELSWSGNEHGDTPSDTSGDRPKKYCKEKEISIACQTEEKSSSSDPGKFYEERKALEKRISEEKKCQIKWIENEIHHLNVLRGLLEKQNYAKHARKKHSATSDNASKIGENYVENISSEGHPRPVTPVYGCTISVSENVLPEVQHSHFHPREGEQGPSQWCHYPVEESQQYGMAVSLSGKDKSKSWRRVVMLPVGVQVSFKDSDLLEDCAYEEMDKEEGSQSHRQHSSKTCAAENVASHQNSGRYGAVSQSDANTQYPSARKTSGNFPSMSVQTSLSPNGRCTRCNEENCVCINLEKSYSSLSHSSRSRISERRGSSKLTSLSEEPELEGESRNKIADSTDNYKKFIDSASDSSGHHSKSKSTHGPSCKCQNSADYKSELPDNYDKRKPTQSSGWKCLNCPVQVSSSVSKPDFSCRCPCQSNIYLNIDKSASDFGPCRCSKVQAQKPNSSCHIIKIQGPKCCSPGKNSCCCKSRTANKKTENQSCQTDLVKIVSEESSSHSRAESADTRSEPSYGRRLPGEGKSGQKIPDANVSEKAQYSRCGCNGKNQKEKSAPNEHPRHYFLRIEEKEVEDDSKELIEQKKSLEVITVTVPVKKVGRAKRIGSAAQEASGNYQDNAKQFDFPSNGCNCCSACIAHRPKPTQDFRPGSSGSFERNVAEKPESPRRDSGPFLRQSQYSSYETENTYGGVSYPSKEFSSRDYYQKKKGFEFPEAECYCNEKPANGSHMSQSCEGCDSARFNSLQEIQSEYDSHKKSRNGNLREYSHDGGPRFNEGGRNLKKPQRTLQSEPSQGRTLQGRSSESRNPRQQEFSPESREAVGRNYDYYNYNRREFMTKSELLKEEEQKRKVHQPSLQECLSSNRPDFYHSAERRRQIISERARERVKKHNNRMECLINLIHRCNEHEQASNKGPKRIFTTVQMREETMRRYKKLPEVTGKLAEQKKMEEYRTNKLMADIFAKKLQSEALKASKAARSVSAARKRK